MSRSIAAHRGTTPGQWAGARSRRTVAALALLAVVPLASACSAGLEAHTSTERSVVDGETAQVGDIVVRYAHLDSPDNPSISQGGTAVAYAGIYNNGPQPDTLTSATSDVATAVDIVAPAGGTASPSPSSTASPASPSSSASPTASASPTGASGSGSASMTIPSGGGLVLMPTTGGHLTLRGLLRPVYAGQNVNLTLTFQNAGRLTLSVPVQVPASPADRPSPTPGAGAG